MLQSVLDVLRLPLDLAMVELSPLPESLLLENHPKFRSGEA